jgi:hypothetical protein
LICRPVSGAPATVALRSFAIVAEMSPVFGGATKRLLAERKGPPMGEAR